MHRDDWCECDIVEQQIRDSERKKLIAEVWAMKMPDTFPCNAAISGQDWNFIKAIIADQLREVIT